MHHPLERKIAEVRRRARWLAVVHGLSLACVAMMLAVFALGTLDYLVRFEDRGLRLVASGGVLAVVGWAAYRFLAPVIRARLSAVALAEQAERHFPTLSNRLVNAVDMLKDAGDLQLGSQTLRDSFIVETTAHADAYDFKQVLDKRPTVLAACFCAAVFGVMMLVLANWPTATKIAVLRILNPWDAASWPRVSHLSILTPVTRMVRGQTFEIEVVDALGAALPDDVRISYRDDGTPENGAGRTASETEPLQRRGRTAMARRESVQRPFAYRIEGGDDRSMPWTQVTLVEPPDIAGLEIELVPPAWYGRRLATSGRDLRAPSGTRVHFRGRATMPLRSARLCLSNGTRIAARIEGDGRSFLIDEPSPLVLEQSGSYWFELMSRDGMVGGSENHWDIVAIANTGPTVRLHRPGSDMFVTPRAVVTVSATATDDIALRDAHLHFRDQSSGQEHRLPLLSGSKQPPSTSADSSNDARDLTFRWSLQALNLQPGTQLSFGVTASDYAAAIGTSDERRLTIVTSDQFRDQVAKRQALIRSDLQTIVERQQRLHREVESLMQGLQEGGHRAVNLPDRLQALSQGQNQISNSLTEPSQLFPKHLNVLENELDSGPDETSTARQQTAQLSTALGELRRDRIQALRRDFGSTIENGEYAAAKADVTGAEKHVGELKETLGRIAQHQAAVVRTLQHWISVLSWSDDYESTRRRLTQMIVDQGRLNQQTAELARRTLSRNLADVSPEDAEALLNRARGQVEMASAIDDLLERMERVGQSTKGADEPTAAAVGRAFRTARELAVGNRMRSVGRQIERNQVGQAIAGQKDILDRLRSIARLLAGENRPASEAPGQDGETPGDAAAGGDRQESQLPGNGRGKEAATKAEKPGSSPGAAVEMEPSSEVARPDPAQTRARMERLWGQLPEHVRQVLLRGSTEEFPAEDAALIEEYFRRLAEEPAQERSRP